MVEQTSNHNLDIPSVGGDSNEWGTILNDLFDGDLDRDVVLKGTYANRPAAGTDTVTLYLATDRRIVYYNDGSTWEAVYGLGTDANPVPGTSHFESINTEEITGSLYGGKTVTDLTGTWETVGTDVDTTTTGSLDLSVSGLSSPTLRVVIEYGHTANSSTSAFLTLSGVTTSSYDYYTEDNTGVADPPTASEFELVSTNNVPVRGAWIIGADDAENDNTRIEIPSIGLDFCAANYDISVLQKGELADSTAYPVTSVNFTTDNVAAGKLYVQEIVR